MSENETEEANGDGRGANGRFVAGNKGGPGNPLAADVGRHRAAFFAALKDSDVVTALRVIRKVMKNGRHVDQLAAAREMLDRIVGRAVASDLLARIEALESRIKEGQ